MLLCPGAGAGPLLVMPAGSAAWGAATSPGRGPMVPGWAVLVMLVLSTLWQCGALPPPEPGQWVWGAAGEVQAQPLLLSRGKRDDSEQQPSATTMPSRIDTGSPEPDLLLGSVPTAMPGTNASLHRARAVPTTADPLDETDAPDPDLLLSSAPAPSTTASLHRARAVPTTTDLLDETDAPDLLLSSAPPSASSTNASLHRLRAVPTTADPLDETDAPDPDLLLGPTTPAEPSTQAAPKHSITTIPSRLTSLHEEVASSTDSSSSVGPLSVTSPSLGPTTTADKKVKKTGDSPAPTHSTPWETTPRGTAVPVPWDPSRLMGKCLLAILLLALVAATFMVCTGVLGARLWRRARTAHRRLSHTEMVCISSLLPDGEGTTNGPKSGPARRQKLLLDGGSELDGDNLTLSSFLPEHS